jgi:hypothetical protein
LNAAVKNVKEVLKAAVLLPAVVKNAYRKKASAQDHGYNLIV